MKLIAELPDNYRPALAEDVPEGRACGNCMFFNEERQNDEGTKAWCEQWEEFVDGGYYCDAWKSKENSESSEDDEDDEESKYSRKQDGMILTFSQDVLTCNKSKRELTGVIVPFGKIGYTNMGEVVFEAGSLSIGEDIKLFTEHDMTQPIGRMISHEVSPIGVIGKFKIANTTAGNDALVLASENLRGAFSIGAKINESSPVDGVLKVTSAELIEVSHVGSPAFAEAQITDVAASADNQTETERETDMEDVKNSEVNAAPEAVEASKTEAVVTAAVAYAKPRVNLDITAGEYVKAQFNATQGNQDARDLVAAIEQSTVAENIGVVPPSYLRDIIGIIDDQMPFANSLEQGTLPATGMKFYRPLIGVQATAAVTAEGVEFDSTDTTITSKEIDVVKIAGANKVTVELLDRSDPAYLDVLLRELAASWAQKADAYAFSIALAAPGTSDADSLYGSIAKGISDSYGVLRRTPNRFLADTGNFATLLSAIDGNDRPLFAAASPQNAAGLMTQGSTSGTIAGLGLVVDPNIDTGSGVEGVIYSSDAATMYRSGAFQLRTNVVSTGEIEVGIYGYVATCAKYPTAFRNLTVTP
jgi:HK97 family phage prohead protease